MIALALGCYLIRLWLVSVQCIDHEGLVLSQRVRLPWSEVASAELKDSVLPYTVSWEELWDNVHQLFDDSLRVFIIFSPIILALGIVVLLILTVLFPVLVLFSPWSSRTTIVLREGSVLAYRDLANGAELVDAINQGVAACTRSSSVLT